MKRSLAQMMHHFDALAGKQVYSEGTDAMGWYKSVYYTILNRADLDLPKTVLLDLAEGDGSERRRSSASAPRLERLATRRLTTEAGILSHMPRVPT